MNDTHDERTAIKTPVEYVEERQILFNVDGAVVYFDEGTSRLHGQQIADALNNQSALAELVEAAEALVTAIDVEYADPNNEDRYMPMQTEIAMEEVRSVIERVKGA